MNSSSSFHRPPSVAVKLRFETKFMHRFWRQGQSGSGTRRSLKWDREVKSARSFMRQIEVEGQDIFAKTSCVASVSHNPEMLYCSRIRVKCTHLKNILYLSWRDRFSRRHGQKKARVYIKLPSEISRYKYTGESLPNDYRPEIASRPTKSNFLFIAKDRASAEGELTKREQTCDFLSAI